MNSRTDQTDRNFENFLKSYRMHAGQGFLAVSVAVGTFACVAMSAALMIGFNLHVFLITRYGFTGLVYLIGMDIILVCSQGHLVDMWQTRLRSHKLVEAMFFAFIGLCILFLFYCTNLLIYIGPHDERAVNALMPVFLALLAVIPSGVAAAMASLVLAIVSHIRGEIHAGRIREHGLQQVWLYLRSQLARAQDPDSPQGKRDFLRMTHYFAAFASRLHPPLPEEMQRKERVRLARHARNRFRIGCARSYFVRCETAAARKSGRGRGAIVRFCVSCRAWYYLYLVERRIMARRMHAFGAFLLHTDGQRQEEVRMIAQTFTHVNSLVKKGEFAQADLLLQRYARHSSHELLTLYVDSLEKPQSIWKGLRTRYEKMTDPMVPEFLRQWGLATEFVRIFVIFTTLSALIAAYAPSEKTLAMVTSYWDVLTETGKFMKGHSAGDGAQTP